MKPEILVEIENKINEELRENAYCSSAEIVNVIRKELGLPLVGIEPDIWGRGCCDIEQNDNFIDFSVMRFDDASAM